MIGSTHINLIPLVSLEKVGKDGFFVERIQVSQVDAADLLVEVEKGQERRGQRGHHLVVVSGAAVAERRRRRRRMEPAADAAASAEQARRDRRRPDGAAGRPGRGARKGGHARRKVFVWVSVQHVACSHASCKRSIILR